MPNLETPTASLEVPVLPAAPTEPEKALPPAEQRLVLHGLDWARYRKISEALTGRRVSLAYDRGALELMTTSRTHDRSSRIIFRLVIVMSEEMGILISSCGSMTCDRPDLEKGVEPDESFYLTNEPKVRQKEEVDLTEDPPPDLTVEVDISRSSRMRMPIHAALGVPEFWRYNGETVEMYRLTGAANYVLTPYSHHFPWLTGNDLGRFLALRTEMDENSLARQFREWVREQIAKAKGESSATG